MFRGSHFISGGVLLILLLSATASAQTRYGASAGITFASLSFAYADSSYSPGINIGVTAGGVVEYPVDGYLYFRGGIFYTQKGAKESEEKFGIKTEYKHNLSYISIPVLAKYYLETEAKRMYALGGLEAGILTSAELERVISGAPPEEGLDINGVTTDDIIDESSRLAVAVNVGGGYTKKMGGGTAFGELQYSFGLLDIESKSRSFSMKSRDVVINFGFMF